MKSEDKMGIRLGVLETGRPPEPLAEDYPDYPRMVADWLGMPVTSMTQFAVLENELPDAPGDADIWVITGSRFGAYDDLPWIKPLEAFIRACRDANVPMVGICFGHQIIAQALGGVVVKSDKGWGVGVHEYDVTDWPEALGKAPKKIRLQALHQDQVTVMPEGAEKIARSEFCENAAIWYPGFAVTFQGHPEFSTKYASDILRIRRGTAIPIDRVDAAMETMDKTPNPEVLAGRIRDWISKGKLAQ